MWNFFNILCILTLWIKISLADVTDFEYDDYLSPCARWRPGDPDLNTFDLMPRFHFDKYEEFYQYDSIREIPGSNNYQIAYHIEEESNLTIQATEAFPSGFPHEFSFECTFRTQEPPQYPWYLFQLTDYSYESQMSVTMNPIYHTVDFSLPRADGEIQTVTFQESSLFDSSWHKLMLGVTQDTVRLWVDCKQVEHYGNEHAGLQPRGPVDHTGGYFSVAQEISNKKTVPIDLQWMVLSCDADKPERTTCEEIPRYDVLPNSPPPKETGEPPKIPSGSYFNNHTSCPEQCPRGPPGFPGATGRPGPPGISGPPGFTGLTGAIGIRGERGEQGLRGLPGLPGNSGESRTLPGERGVPGIEGSKGERGERGFTGEMGRPGLPGSPGLPGTPGISTISGKPIVTGMQGAPGVDGLPGHPGERGHDGQNGSPGPPGNPGPAGLTGAPGISGPPGLPGTPGAPGSPGYSSVSHSENSEFGSVDEAEIRDICMSVVRDYIAEMSASLIGPPGPPGRSKPGRPGNAGPQGPPGETGQRGLQGQRGFNGLPGTPGNNGIPGSSGERGEKGERGADGIGREGQPGPRGLQGVNGEDGMPGRPGENGDMGRTGESGPRGPAGQPGVCPDCVNYGTNAAAYYSLLNYQQQQNSKGPQNLNTKG